MISRGGSWYNAGMTIKKTVKVKPTGSPAASGASAGGATIADRFKLDAPDPKLQKAAGPATTCALIAGLIALAVVGILTYVIWQHWEFLMPA